MITDDLDPPPYDDGYNDDEPQMLGITSISEMQKKALYLFGKFVEQISGMSMPTDIPEHAKKYLPVSELEAIVRDYAIAAPIGWVIGAETEHEAQQKMRHMIGAIMERILSNVMADGVKRGWLDCEFDIDSGKFAFSLTEAGRQVRHQHYKN